MLASMSTTLLSVLIFIVSLQVATGLITGQAHHEGQSPIHHQTARAQKCSRQSIALARQMIIHELEALNVYNSIWFNDFDQEELLEGQKQSLSNIVMSGAGTKLLNGDGQPLLEIEASYFRPISVHSNLRHQSTNITRTTSSTARSHNNHPSMSAHAQPITLKLIRRHQDRCYLNEEKSRFTYVLALSVGPLEHHLDVIYNLPKELRLSQPVEARYAQISVLIPHLTYEITLKQVANYEIFNSPSAGSLSKSFCPMEVNDVTFMGSSSAGSSGFSIITSGLAANNQTILQVERIFDDYSRPAISSRLRQILKFNLNTKTLPLSI